MELSTFHSKKKFSKLTVQTPVTLIEYNLEVKSFQTQFQFVWAL